MKIGDLEVVRRTRQILSNGLPVRISSRAYDLLEVLLDANGALVPTATIIERVWPSTIVEENNIQVHVCALRRIFGAHRSLIQTVSGRGYRLTVPDSHASDIAPASVSQRVATANLPPLDRRFRLPERYSPLFGRDPFLSSLVSELERHPPLITLTGAPGSGKSRLAIEASHILKERRGYKTAYLSMSTPSSRDDPRAALDELVDSIAPISGSNASGESLLVVIDNCDLTASHLIESLNHRRLFSGHAQTTVLATSRSPLKLSMEKTVYVDSLLPAREGHDHDAAIDLFVSRLRMLDPHANRDEAFVEKVRELVTQLDRLPLAIEFAVHQTALLGIDVVISLLDRNIGLPAQRMRGLSDTHHVSFDAALRWTWVELSPKQHAILARFSQGGTDAELDDLCAIGTALDMPLHESLEAISALVDHAFIFRFYDESSIRYRLPHTIRRFVRSECLNGHLSSGEAMSNMMANTVGQSHEGLETETSDNRVDMLSS